MKHIDAVEAINQLLSAFQFPEFGDGFCLRLLSASLVLLDVLLNSLIESETKARR
jgi:hypothetical protein